MKNLPIGIQEFSKLRNGNYLYVDKTKDIYGLIKNPSGYYFLSRPRRFGKSLLISTLQEIFEGNKDLFQGLWLEQSEYKWDKHPVIRIDFSKIPSNDVFQFLEEFNKRLLKIASEHSINLDGHSGPAGKMGALIEELHTKQNQKVVILIDEYDSPIISNIKNQAVLDECRNILASFFRTIKGSDPYLRFVLLTGVSKFAKVSVFSGLNNLSDISLDSRFATLLGYTQAEVESNFAEHIMCLKDKVVVTYETILEEMKRWYNGYRFSEIEARVYNPFSILQLLDKQLFQNYWFETGTPSFLLDLIRRNNYNVRSIPREILSYNDFNSYEVEEIPLLPILFNTGYLTISEVEVPRPLHFDYRLDYPNNEVRISFLEQFVDSAFTKGTNARNYVRLFTDCIREDDLAKLLEGIRAFFAELPYDIQSPNRNTEAYYQSLVYCLFKLVGHETYVEERTNKGRIDLVVQSNDTIYLFEMKVDKPANIAIEQIKKNGYAERYAIDKKKIVLVGLSFSSSERNISEFEVENGN